jgi:methionyl-tRNA formyltransferase
MTAPVPPHPRRLAFLGTPAAAVAPFEALLDAGFDVPIVVSRADAKRGRGGALQPSPVKAAALARGVPVTERIEDVLDAEVDLGVVVAYGRIIRPVVLDVVPMVNLHFSLLPRWRGAAPVERAILAGDDRTGVCLMGVEEGLDTGPVYGRVELAIGADETADELRGRLVEAGSRLLVDQLQQGLGRPEAQVGEPVYAEKIRPSELEIDWTAPAASLHRLVRVGGAWTTFRGRRLKIWRTTVSDEPTLDRAPGAPAGLAPGQLDGRHVGTGDGTLELVEVQPEGKGRQAASAWRNGAQPGPADRLGG